VAKSWHKQVYCNIKIDEMVIRLFVLTEITVHVPLSDGDSRTAFRYRYKRGKD
jgi:hypothetical protein